MRSASTATKRWYKPSAERLQVLTAELTRAMEHQEQAIAEEARVQKEYDQALKAVEEATESSGSA